ncbi:dynactin subunit 6, putative, partial [Acanthamoeba castellanii str. Neff]
CTLEGNIHIGEGTVLHPRCKIIAEKGSITIGKYNIIEEHSTIVNSHEDVMRIGNFNLIEVGAQVNSRRIGDRNTIEIRCSSLIPLPVLGEGTVVGNDCVVGTGVKLPPNDVLPDSVVVHAPRNSRRTLSDTKEVGEKPLYPTTTILAHNIKLTAVTFTVHRNAGGRHHGRKLITVTVHPTPPRRRRRQ